MLVVDASVAVKWFLVEPGDREALALLDAAEPLVAPELIVAEVVNVVWKRLMAGAIEVSQAADVPQELQRLFAQLFPLGPLADRALEIAHQLRHPAYDCFYLALAETQGARLVTADRRFAQRIGGTSWEAQTTTLWS
jgi:predicted nucleic acid-binding protein